MGTYVRARVEYNADARPREKRTGLQGEERLRRNRIYYRLVSFDLRPVEISLARFRVNLSVPETDFVEERGARLRRLSLLCRARLLCRLTS